MPGVYTTRMKTGFVPLTGPKSASTRAVKRSARMAIPQPSPKVRAKNGPSARKGMPRGVEATVFVSMISLQWCPRHRRRAHPSSLGPPPRVGATNGYDAASASARGRVPSRDRGCPARIMTMP